MGEGLRLRFTHTLRSFSEQEDLYALGRTKLVDKKGKKALKVTNAAPGESMHNYGLAFDIALLLDLDGNGTFEIASWDTKLDTDNDLTADWTEVANHFKHLGWTWGGDWKNFRDYPHFEKSFGYTWRTLKAKYLSGETFSEIIDGKIYKWVNI